MIFAGFPSIQDSSGVSNSPARPTLGDGDASFAEVALGLIGSPPPIGHADGPAGKTLVSTARIAPGAEHATRADNSAAPVANAPLSAPVALTTPVALTSPQTQSMFSCVLTPAQYLENAMAEIQSGAPVSSDTPMTVAEVLQQRLNDYSTPQNPYAECHDPAAAAALIARIAGPNANVLLPTVAGMTTAYIPSTPARWVGNYTMGYATQSSGFNDASETFGG